MAGLVGAWALVGARASALAAAVCTVAGPEARIDRGGDVVVRPAKGQPFPIEIFDMAVEAAIPAKQGALVPLNVKGAISFRATARSLSYRISQVVDGTAGMVRLAPGAQVIQLKTDGGGVVGAAILFADSVCRGQPDEIVEPVYLPCAALTLDGEVSGADENAAPKGDGSWWRIRAHQARVGLHASPSANAKAVVIAQPTDGEGQFTFQGLDARPGWTRVFRAGENVVVTGWIPDTELESIPEERFFGGGYACQNGPGLHGGSRRAQPNLYDGRARIAVGTTIYSDDQRGAWATVEKEEGFRVRYAGDATWAEVTQIPGLGGWEVRAYVPVAAITRAP